MADSQLRSNAFERNTSFQDSSECGQSKAMKGDRSRRCWSDREEATLIAGLKELVAIGWNPIMVLELDIYNVNTWKKNYSSICSILDRSGVGFNAHDDYKIECEDEQWSQIVQDNNARYMRNKSWPLWEEWKEIFGKDRAVGARSRGAAESAAMMHGSRPMDMDVDYHPSLDELFPDEVVANEVVGEHAIPEPGNSSNTHGERSAQKPVKIGGQISGLTMKQKFYTSAKLVKESELLDLFRSMPEDDRPEFVVFKLESDGMI
ncbi:hypothetical protein SASPL_140302 [Salvia splendens]|uniref:Uncharacterized protein n=1 Tax=Salvia splendens TaxID=180675 RepID=A0A8X8ZBH8_SALSN|nr:hypothetical protein SASPL_140302 [Salvia splendens]